VRSTKVPPCRCNLGHVSCVGKVDDSEARAVDEFDLRDFVHREYPRLVAAVALITGSRAAAEDVVQEALVRAWQLSARGERIDSLAAWTRTVSLNLARSGLRRVRAELRAKQRIAAGIIRQGEPSGVRVDIRRALRRLPRRQREAIVLRYYLDLDVAEVAAAMGTPVGTVKSLLSRARSSLGEALGETDLAEVQET
jgi:RNA polymerase sigma-70 factor (sigma-E family)